MPDHYDYPVERELDGVYFRLERNGAFKNICFSDMTVEERATVIKKYDTASLQRLCIHLADCLRRIGDTLDIYAQE